MVQGGRTEEALQLARQDLSCEDVSLYKAEDRFYAIEGCGKKIVYQARGGKFYSLTPYNQEFPVESSAP